MRNRRLGTLMLAAAMTAIPAAIATAPPATAARLVFDPWNHSKNILTAARSLEQIRNQITSLQNEATMLINEARNLANLPQSSLAQLQEAFSQTQDLMREAQRIAYDVQAIEVGLRGDLPRRSLWCFRSRSHRCRPGTLAELGRRLRGHAENASHCRRQHR